MIHRFATYEDASIYAGIMRSEGYFAAILDESMGSIWGPLATVGIRVIVSDEPVEEDEEDMPPVPSERPFDSLIRAARLTALAVAGIGILLLALMILKFPLDYLSILIEHLIPLAIAFFFGCLIIPLVEPFNRALRDESSAFGSLIRFLTVLYFVAYAFFCLSAIAYSIWHDIYG